MVSVGLYFMALVPRLNAIWRGFITPDEPIWVYRSFRFLQALSARRWPDTFQIGHPGVVTMWMGALGIWWQRWRDPLNAAAYLEWVDRVAWVTPDNAALFDRLAPFLPPARLAMAALTFSLGGLAVWMPTFFTRFWGMNVGEAGTLFGGLTVVAGIVAAVVAGLLFETALIVLSSLLGAALVVGASMERLKQPLQQPLERRPGTRSGRVARAPSALV